MEKSDKQEQRKNQFTEIKTFSVPLTLEEITKNITFKIITASREEIIEQAFKFHSLGNIQESIKYYQCFIDQGFKDYRVFSNYGVILKDLGNLKEAELLTRKAIEIKSDYAKAHSNLGIILKDLGNLKEAELSTRKAIELKPDYTNAHSNLGNILKDLGNLKEAEFSARKAIELKPDYANAYLNLSIILKGLGNLKEAELSTRKAIELKPDFAKAYSNLGNILIELGHLKEAEFSQRKAIELEPDYTEAFWNLSLIELLQGNYKNGLENYEYRFEQKSIDIHAKPKIKKLVNKKFQDGDKLLVICEQGLGDTLQYMRYIPYLKTLGLDVSFCAQPKLHTLIQSSGIDQNPLTPDQSNLVSEGKWIPLLSLPRYLKVSPENPIISKPYIHSTEKLNLKWKNIFSQEKKPIVGINWQGSPDMEKYFYQGRSIPLELFSIVMQNNAITMVSLQKGYGTEQLEHCSFKNKFIKCQPQIDSTWDFLENAAIINNCDLIITCDTSIAHLAGGMGKKVWLLLRDIPFWTWGLERESTFWYPSMKLFRQKERHNWSEVMERLSLILKKEMEAKF